MIPAFARILLDHSYLFVSLAYNDLRCAVPRSERGQIRSILCPVPRYVCQRMINEAYVDRIVEFTK